MYKVDTVFRDLLLRFSSLVISYLASQTNGSCPGAETGKYDT